MDTVIWAIGFAVTCVVGSLCAVMIAYRIEQKRRIIR